MGSSVTTTMSHDEAWTLLLRPVNSHTSTERSRTGSAATARYLEGLAMKIMHAHNTIVDPSSRDFLRANMSADFHVVEATAHEDTLPFSSTASQHIENVLALHIAYPQVRRPCLPTGLHREAHWASVIVRSRRQQRNGRGRPQAQARHCLVYAWRCQLHRRNGTKS